MQLYIIKRILMTLLVLLLVVVFLSLLVHIVPGDPVRTILGPRASPGLIQQMRAAMDLDKPIYVQIWPLPIEYSAWQPGDGCGYRRADHQTDRQRVAPYPDACRHQPPAGNAYRSANGGIFRHPSEFIAGSILAIVSISFTTIPSYVAGLFLLLIFAVKLHALPAMGLGRSGDLTGLFETFDPAFHRPRDYLDWLSGPFGAHQPIGSHERNLCARCPGQPAFLSDWSDIATL